MTTEALKRAQKKYHTEKTRLMSFRLNLKTDADILQKLDQVPSKQGYIKALIRSDINNNGG